jgi:hypothetical protein
MPMTDVTPPRLGVQQGEGAGGSGGEGAGGGDVFRVAYSLHSSFEQLESFLDFLRPISVIGGVARHHTRQNAVCFTKKMYFVTVRVLWVQVIGVQPKDTRQHAVFSIFCFLCYSYSSVCAGHWHTAPHDNMQFFYLYFLQLQFCVCRSLAL